MSEKQQVEMLLELCKRILKEISQPNWLIYSTYRAELNDPLGDVIQGQILSTPSDVESYLNQRLEHYKPELGIFVDIACLRTLKEGASRTEWVHVGFNHNSPDLIIQKADYVTEENFRIANYSKEKFHEIVSLLMMHYFPRKKHFASWHEKCHRLKSTDVILNLFSQTERPDPNYLNFLVKIMEICEKNYSTNTLYVGDYHDWRRAIVNPTLKFLQENGFRLGDKSSINGNSLLTATWHTQEISREIKIRANDKRQETGYVTHPNELNNEFIGQLQVIYNQLAI